MHTELFYDIYRITRDFPFSPISARFVKTYDSSNEPRGERQPDIVVDFRWDRSHY
jgi:hypothetical protein